MRNIWRIIRADARSLFTHFFALAVALAIAVLPSLYAWLNIYSNWDPYGNTGNISIAVASLDKGWTEEDGTQVNKGREVVEDLRTSTSINWVAVDTKEEAERGVYAGDYYAAVVIDEDFSYNMYHMLTEWTDKPTITYYENYKKNAVATKITDTAVSSLKTTISKSYLDVVVDAIFRGANDLSQQLSQAIDNFGNNINNTHNQKNNNQNIRKGNGKQMSQNIVLNIKPLFKNGMM